MKRAVVLVLLVLLVGIYAPASDLSLFSSLAREARGKGAGLSFVVEQNGRYAAPGNGGTVTVSRAPFIVWVLFTGVPGLLMNISTTPTLFDQVSRGIDPAVELGDQFDMLMGAAEYDYNPDHALMIDELAAHYLALPGEGIMRFNRVLWEPEFVAAGRDVSMFFDLSAARDYPVEDLPYSRLYFTGMQTERDASMSQSVVEGTSFILRFVTLQRRAARP